MHLLNPLLQKYTFDPYDFMDGARTAIVKLIKTVHSKEMALMRAGRAEASTETLGFLQSTLCTSLYLASTKAPAHVTAQKVVTDVSLERAHLEFVSTRVVTPDWFFRRLVEFSLTQYMLGLTQDPYTLTRAVRENKMDEDIDQSALMGDAYPMDSVLAVVVVHAQYKETSFLMPHLSPASEEAQSVAETHTQEREGRWIFEGVISGQTDLRWIVRSYDHVGMLEDHLLP
ncbi:hypothetical protein EON64_13230 [archaeon]|nr:MAG: hypothetical protein EON64_13230 [archaeon]